MLRLERYREISIKYNLSITFAPKNIVSPLRFLFYLFCVVFPNFCRLLMSFAFASLFLDRFMGVFFMLRRPIIPYHIDVSRFSLT